MEIKPSLLRRADGFTARKAVDLLCAVYPAYAEVFELAYPLDDDAVGLRDPRDTESDKWITQEEIAARCHLSQATVSGYLDKSRFFFKALYEGVIQHPRISPDRGDNPRDEVD